MSCYYNHRLFQIPKRKFYQPRFLATMGGAYSHNLITSVFGKFHDVIGTKLCVGGQQQIIRHTVEVLTYIGDLSFLSVNQLIAQVSLISFMRKKFNCAAYHYASFNQCDSIMTRSSHTPTPQQRGFKIIKIFSWHFSR